MTDDFSQYSAHVRLNRLEWLRSQGCEFSFDIDAKIKEIREDAPDWKPEFAEGHVHPKATVKSGWVKTDTNPDELTTLPIASIVPRARELSGRTSDFLVERDPFSGLAERMPGKALAALRIAAEQDLFVNSYWTRFLEHEARQKKDSDRFRLLIAGRLANLTNEQFAEITHSAARWFEKASKPINTLAPQLFTTLWDRLIEQLMQSESANTSALVRQGGPIDWLTEAINSTAGELAEIQMKLLPGSPDESPGMFPETWLLRTNQLLRLKNPSRQYSLVLLSHNLEFLFWYDPSWTRRELLEPIKSGEDADTADAIWSGFFWGARTPNEVLFKELKPHLLSLASSGTPRRKRHGEVLGGILLAGWAHQKGGERLVGSAELREVILGADDDFRSHLIWQLERWSSEERWASALVPFLSEVWPKQKKARTPAISSRLLDLLLEHPQRFEELARIIAPLLSRIEPDSLAFYKLTREDDGELLAHHPQPLLDLLYTVLPEEIQRWPYEANGVVRRLASLHPELLNSPKMLELLSRVENA